MANWGLGLAGEAGEAADLIKKYAFHGHELDREKLKKELGDVAWYLAVAAWELGYPLEGVLAANVQKLRARYPEGFSNQASIERADLVSSVLEENRELMNDLAEND